MEAPNPLPQHATDAASAPVGSIDHILRGVLSDVLSSADHQLAAAAATAGDEVLQEGRQVSQPLNAVRSLRFFVVADIRGASSFDCRLLTRVQYCRLTLSVTASWPRLHRSKEPLHVGEKA